MLKRNFGLSWQWSLPRVSAHTRCMRFFASSISASNHWFSLYLLLLSKVLLLQVAEGKRQRQRSRKRQRILARKVKDKERREEMAEERMTRATGPWFFRINTAKITDTAYEGEVYACDYRYEYVCIWYVRDTRMLREDKTEKGAIQKIYLRSIGSLITSTGSLLWLLILCLRLMFQ